MNGTPAHRSGRRLPGRRGGRRRARRCDRGLGVARDPRPLRRLGRGRRRVDPAGARGREAVLAVPQGRRPRHGRHADDAGARPTPTPSKRDHLEAHDVERLMVPLDRRREDVDPRARPRGPALPPPVPRREVARAEASLRPRRPARGRRREHRQLRRRDVHRAGRDRQRRRPGRRVRRGARPDRGAPVELRPRGGRRPRRGRRRGDATRGDASRAIVETALRLAKDGTRAAIEAVVAAAVGAGRLALGRARVAAQRVRAVRLRRRALRDARRRTRGSRAACTRSRSCRSRSGCSSATGGDCAETILGGVNYGRDSDSIASMGGALAGALGGIGALPTRLGRGGLGGEQDRHRGGRPRRWPSSRPRSSRSDAHATRSVRVRWPRSRAGEVPA